MLCIAVTLWLLILGAKRKIAWWWSLIAALVTVVWHIFAVALLVAPLYLGLRSVAQTARPPAYLQTMRRWLPVTLLLLGIVTILVLANWSLFVLYALVPITANRVTADGYTLLSFSHVADLVNMLFVLVPGAAVMLIAIRRRPPVAAIGDDLPHLLTLIVIPAWLIVAVFDPNLGMARDWDIFAFAGLPTVLLLSILLLERQRYFALALAGVLAALVLLPRAVAQTQPDTAIAHFLTWSKLDPQKSKSGRYVLVKYFNEHNNEERALAEEARWKKDYPSFEMEHQAEQLFADGQFQAARGMSMRAIKLDPRAVAAYVIIARSCMATGDAASALTYVSIANAINPYSANTLHILGGIECAMGKVEQGLENMRIAQNIGDSTGNITSDIAQICLMTGDLAAAGREIQLLSANPTALPYLFVDLTESLMSLNQVALAQATLGQAIHRGADGAAVTALKGRHASLRDIH